MIYLDDAATAMVWPEVVEAMSEVMLENYGNPSSLHAYGESANDLVEGSREVLANAIGAKQWELTFTSGGTEADNLALFGLACAYPEKKKIIVSSIEHAAVLSACDELGKKGYTIVKVPVSSEGIIDLDKLKEKIGDGKDVLVVSIMHVNNIIGTIEPVKEIGELCKSKGVLFHTDACQSFGKLKIDVSKMNIDLLSASGHKIGGPKGIGFLYVREGVKVKPIIVGGGQEHDKRSGTQNTPGIIGFGKAYEIFRKYTRKDEIEKLRDYLIEKIGGRLNGSLKDRIYNNVHVSFENVESDSLVIYLSEKGFCVSSGSACDSKKQKEDHVLNGIGVDQKKYGSIRVTLNSKTTKKDIDNLVESLNEILKTFKAI